MTVMTVGVTMEDNKKMPLMHKPAIGHLESIKDTLSVFMVEFGIEQTLR